jgi:hypothetical protein
MSTISALQPRPSNDLTQYDPDKGLKLIALAEVAEKYFRRAKNPDQLYDAISVKLAAQRDFVLWWDQQEKNKGAARPRGNGSVTALRMGDSGLPDKMVVSRWRQRLADPKRFEAALEHAKDRCLRIVEARTSAHVAQHTGETDWYTPARYVDAARLVLGAIDLDPASDDVANSVVQATRIFTAEDQALDRMWEGRVWMNPPYRQPLIDQFCAKLVLSVKVQTVPAAVVLVNNATETAWFQRLLTVSSALCLPAGRIRYWHPDRPEALTPLQGQALIYMGEAVDWFTAVFRLFGVVIETAFVPLEYTDAVQ